MTLNVLRDCGQVQLHDEADVESDTREVLLLNSKFEYG